MVTGGPLRRAIAATCLALLATGCGGGGPTLGEYAAEVEALTTAVYARMDELNAELSGETTVADIQYGYNELAVAFRRLLEGFQALEPPDEFADLHTAALDLAGNLTNTAEDFAQVVGEVETDEELAAVFETPEFQAATVAQTEIVDFCLERQAEFDATADREAFADEPWIPTEMQQVVLVAFGCDVDRPTGP